MQNFKEVNQKLKGDHYIHGSFMKDGTDVHVKSVANFDGFECRIWSPEFHGIMLDSAIFHAKESELVRTQLEYFDNNGVKELVESDSNTENSFRVIQHAINAIVMSVACIESWANKTIRNELNENLTFERIINNKAIEVSWGASRIEKDADLLEKVFVVIPLIFKLDVIKPHVTVRQRMKEIIVDRNTVVHMKHMPKIGEQGEYRRVLALKLLRRDALLVIQNAIAPIKLLHEKSKREIPIWLSENIGSLVSAQKQLKKM